MGYRFFVEIDNCEDCLAYILIMSNSTLSTKKILFDRQVVLFLISQNIAVWIGSGGVCHYLVHYT